jgi:glyoxylase-like metal-dependent hydrolase (beta-lactamase superfamily II)
MYMLMIIDRSKISFSKGKKMNKPTRFESFQVTPDTMVLPSYFPIPGLGIIPVNAFLIKAAEPVLVDTGLMHLSREFMAGLAALINPGDIKWLWLTHTDQDHIGNLRQLLDELPDLRIVTSFLGVGKMSLFQPLPMDRIYLLNPGQTLDVGDRKLQAIRPPTYDAPETVGFFDAKSGIFFSADCFGALMSAPAVTADDIGSEPLREGLVKWTTVDAPWLHGIDRGLFAGNLDNIRKLAPKVILSSHLPPAFGMVDELLGYLELALPAAPFVGPDQAAFEAMLKGPGGK